MNTKIILAIVSLFTYLTLPSCSKDWYDIKSNKNQTVPNTLEDLELLLDDYPSVATNTPGLIEVSADGHHILESGWQLFLADYPENNNVTNAYTWSYNRPYLQVSDWNSSYKKIFLCNLVLSTIEKIERDPSNLNQYDRIKGNALFIKAKTYLELAQLYAEPYKSGESSTYGLPLRNGIDITEHSPRSSVAETYELIEKSIKSAISLLPNYPQVATRASKNSCYALLSRFYLITNNYPECIKYSDSSLQLNNLLLNYNNLPIGAATIGIFNSEVVFHSRMSNYPMVRNLYSYVDSSLFNTYENNDLRKLIFFQQADSGHVFIGNYSDNGIPFSGLANDEILLNRSEANARQNKIELAMGDLNTLLMSRFKTDGQGNSTYQPYLPVNQDEAIDIIIKERRKELIYRGVRWSDIRRLKDDPIHAQQVERTIGSMTYKLNQDFQYTLPIPEDEISLSSIPQNQGW